MPTLNKCSKDRSKTWEGRGSDWTCLDTAVVTHSCSKWTSSRSRYLITQEVRAANTRKIPDHLAGSLDSCPLCASRIWKTGWPYLMGFGISPCLLVPPWLVCSLVVESSNRSMTGFADGILWLGKDGTWPLSPSSLTSISGVQPAQLYKEDLNFFLLLHFKKRLGRNQVFAQ